MCSEIFRSTAKRRRNKRLIRKKKLNHRKASNIIESHLIILRYRFLIGNEKTSNKIL